MDLGLKGRVAIVTAASSGLGKATAAALASEGAAVVINARNADRLEKAASEISAISGADVLTIAGDVTNISDVRLLVDSAIQKYNRLDILVTNAGGPPAGFFRDFDTDQYRKAIELNLLSIVNLCREAVPVMQKAGWGRIVAITSIASKQPIENLILSNTARAGALGFLKSLSNQVAVDGITVNTVCPGYHLTERLKTLGASMAESEGVTVEEIYDRWAEVVPMKRIGNPEEFATMVTFLCSEQASYVTGTTIQVDGGFVKSIL